MVGDHHDRVVVADALLQQFNASTLNGDDRIGSDHWRVDEPCVHQPGEPVGHQGLYESVRLFNEDILHFLVARSQNSLAFVIAPKASHCASAPATLLESWFNRRLWSSIVQYQTDK